MRALSLPLIVLFFICIFLLILTVDSSPVREFLCNRDICFRSRNSLFWNEVWNTFAAGGAISILFFWILVKSPEYRKRQRVKRNLAAQYKSFKISCIENFLAVGDGGFNSKLPEKLVTVTEFRNYFKEETGYNKNRWHDVHNNMTDYYLTVTLSRMEILRQEVSVAMQSIDISETDAFKILNYLSHTIVLQRNATRDYDSIRSFLGVFWELFAGWNGSTGYRDSDMIDEVIESI